MSNMDIRQVGGSVPFIVILGSNQVNKDVNIAMFRCRVLKAAVDLDLYTHTCTCWSLTKQVLSVMSTRLALLRYDNHIPLCVCVCVCVCVCD